MKIKKLKSTVIATSILVFSMVGSCFAYSSDFKGTFTNGNYINGGDNGKYYSLEAKNTTVSGTARVTNPDGTTYEGAYIEVRRVTSYGSAQALYLSTGKYKNSITFKGSFKAVKGKHYLVLRKANRNYPGSISGTISQ